MIKFKFLLFFYLFIIIFPVIVGNSDSVTNSIIIVAEADSFVNSISPLTNHGNLSYMSVSDSSNSFTGIQIGYIRFDLTGITEEVRSAVVKLHTSGVFVTETHIIGIYECPDTSWDELTVNYNNRPSYNSVNLDTQTVSVTSQWFRWSVTSTIQEAINSEKVSFVLLSEDVHNTAWVWFESKDQEYPWMDEYRPKLEIEFNEGNLQSSNPFLLYGLIIFGMLMTGAVIVFIYKKNQKLKKYRFIPPHIPPQYLPNQPSPHYKSKFCTNCGTALKGIEKFCPDCGKNVG
jgi:hypothetical protein